MAFEKEQEGRSHFRFALGTCLWAQGWYACLQAPEMEGLSSSAQEEGEMRTSIALDLLIEGLGPGLGHTLGKPSSTYISPIAHLYYA